MNNKTMSEFVIGVTGHRDIAATEVDGLRDSVRAALSDIAGRFSAMPVRVVTGLAEGADTVVTEIALELGLKVTAVLPMPRDAYADDFAGAALDTLNALLENPDVEVREMPATADLTTAEGRDAQYAMLGDYLIRRPNLLLAIWNGEVTGLAGGPSEVLLGFLAGSIGAKIARVPQASATMEDCNDIALWIPVRRESNLQAQLPARAEYLVANSNADCYWPASELPAQIAARWKALDEFAALGSSDLGADLAAYGLAGADASDEASALDYAFIRADQIARANQVNSDRMFKLFGLLAAAMGLFFLVYAKLLAAKFLLVLYVAIFVFGFIGFRISANRHWLGHHLAYRVLAETLRVQYFLVRSGAGRGYRLLRILKLTSVDRFKRFEWLQDAIRSAEPLHYGVSQPAEAISAVQGGWIDDQLGYFRKRLHAMHKEHLRLERIKSALLLGSVVGALALIFFKKELQHLEMTGFDGKTWLVFFMGLLPLWVAVWELYQGKMATRELLWQYANQQRYFSAAAHQIGTTADLDAQQQILRDLADKVLIEIYLWSVHRYHREHEPPAAG